MIWLFLIAFSTPEGKLSQLPELNAGLQQVYDAIVKPDGTVDYARLNRDKDLQKKLNRYVQFMADVDPTSIQDPKQKIALLANTYNVFTLTGVNKAWPVKSVRNIRVAFGFFTKKEWQLGGKKVSLNNIENKHLRKLDQRIHVLINCASGSCPVLLPDVYTAVNVEAQMEKAMNAFLRDEKRNRFDKKTKTWHLSSIFKWYAEDWGKEADVVAYIKTYRKDLIWSPKKVTYLDYDWSLNGPTGK